MSPRHRRDHNSPNDDSDRTPEYTVEEVETLTRRAEELLAQLHEVLGEMAEHLQSVGRRS